MTRRIFLSILLVTLIAVVSSAALLTAILFPYFDNKLENELLKQLNYLAPGTIKDGSEYLESVDSVGNQITLIAPDGTILYCSDAAVLAEPSVLEQEEIQQALSGQVGRSTRSSHTLGKKSLNCAILLSDGNVLRLAGTQYSAIAVLLSLIQPILIVIFFTAVLSGVFAYRLSHKLTRPLDTIDLENPAPAQAPYPELKPLLRRLHHQNKQISAQIVQLQSQQQQFSAITKNMQEGLLVLNSEGRILSYNTSAAALLNTSCSLSNVTAYKLSDDLAFHDSVRKALLGSHSESIINVNGRICRLFANPAYQNDALAGAVLLLLDITEQYQREALRREFSANVSHELKTPLTSISGIAEIMSSDLMAPCDFPQFAKKIYNESQRLIKLVQDIIRISQLDENSVNEQFESIDLYAAVKAVLARLESVSSVQKIEMLQEGSSAFIYGVPSILDEMIFNLCENAIKYNVEHGRVVVHTGIEQSQAFICISDTGIGIPPEHQARVFERFYRVDKSHSRAIGGTGLGLSIVKHGAALHHAQIMLESTPNIGTTISLSFPLYSDCTN